MPQEKIFTSFTPEQAATYAKNRGLDYPQQLYDTILDFHLGGRNVVLDVGTGPGTVVFNLLPFFAKCLGCDSSESMIKQAKQTAERLQVGDRVAYALCSGEECDQAFPNDKADVMTLALRWGRAVTCVFNPSTPNHAAIQAIFDDLENRILLPYMTPGTLLTKNLYRDLKLPWDFPDSETLFAQAAFQRRDWDLDGVSSSEPLADGTPGPFAVVRDPKAFGSSISMFVKTLGSTSRIIRWRQAHPDTANTEEDILQVAAGKLREANGGKDEVWLSPSMSLLLMRRA